MDTENAAGQKTETVLGDRCDRIAAGLESDFRECQTVLQDCLGTVRRNGGYTPEDMKTIASFLKTSAYLAGAIGRLENLKNRTSKVQ